MNNNANNNGQMAVADKANAILRAKLENLTELHLSFEKRTGNFFKAYAAKNEQGEDILKRSVLLDSDILSGAGDKADAVEVEMNAKRAAATVANIDTDRAKAAAKVEEARAALKEAEENAEKVESDYNAAAAIVEGYELPEKAQRATLATTTAALNTATAELERLRAILAAAGIEA